MPDRGRVGDLADKVVVPRVSHLRDERARRFEQERVSLADHDLADLAPELLAVAGDSDDDRVVLRAEPTLAHGLPEQRVAVAHYRFDEHAVGPGLVEFDDLIRRRFEATDFLKIDNRIDLAHKDKPVTSTQSLVGPDRSQD